MTEKEIDKLMEYEFIDENKRLNDIYSHPEFTDDLLTEMLQPDEESWEIVKLCDTYIHSMEYLTFHEKTWLYLSRNGIAATDLAKKLNVSIMLSPGAGPILPIIGS